MAHKVIVTVGELHGADIDSYVNITAKGGTCVPTAIGSLLDTQVTLNLAMLTLMQKNLQGTIFGGGNPHHDIPQLAMYKAGKLNLDDMVTRQYKLEQINDGYRHAGGRNIRGVIRPRTTIGRQTGDQPLCVFQVASGNVGTEMLKRIVKHPDLRLVGLHC